VCSFATNRQRARSRRYGVNGTAQGLGYSPIDAIWRHAETTYDCAPVARISEAGRQRIFVSVVACQDAGNGDAPDEECLGQARHRLGLIASEIDQNQCRRHLATMAPTDPHANQHRAVDRSWTKAMRALTLTR
jgi:hypothetical protein